MGPDEDSTHLGRRAETRRPETPEPPAADARLFAEGLWAAFSSGGGAPALLQPGMPASGAAVVAVEGAAELPGDSGGQRKTQWAKPALPRTGQKAETSSAARGRSGSREGHHSQFFSITVATGRAAMRDSTGNRDRRTGASVHAPAGAPWNEFGNASGAGARRRDSRGRERAKMAAIIPTY